MEQKYIKLLSDLCGKLSDKDLDSLSFICERVMEINKKINITAVDDELGIYTRHIADSLSLLSVKEFADSSAPRVCDIGCGGGFPGLPVKAVKSDIRLTMVDSTEKKLRTVEETAKLMGLEKISFQPARAEELARKGEYREKFDFVFARAVASLNVLCELCLPFVSVGGYFLAMKAAKAKEELEDAKKAITALGGKVVRIENVSFSGKTELSEYENELSPEELTSLSDFLSSERYVIVIKKVSSCNGKYPRNYSAILKKPL